MRAERNEEWYNCICPICGKKFHAKPSHIKACKHNYCSRKCFYESKTEIMSGENNHQYGLKGKLNASFKDEITIHGGYAYAYVGNHPFADSRGRIRLHRLIAEQNLLTEENSIDIDGKRYLRKEYDVHHINFDGLDNRIENLLVLKRGDHAKLHTKLNPNKRDKETGRFMKYEIRIKKVSPTAKIPEKKTDGAAGYDLYADIKEDVIIKPHESVMINSGLAFSIPKGYFGAIYARSGLAIKDGLRPSTCVSVIDSDYRGNVGLPIYNDSMYERTIRPKDRIAQIIFQKSLEVDFEEAEELDKTERENNGFGSTGR